MSTNRYSVIPAYSQILLRQLSFTLGPFWSLHNTQNQRVCGVLHCALLLHVAMQFGLYHLPEEGAWRKVSEDSGESRPFLLIDRTTRIFTTAQIRAMSTCGYSVFPAYSQVYLRNYNLRSCPNYLPYELYIVDSTPSFTKLAYSYGRRLPGLRSRASPFG